MRLEADELGTILAALRYWQESGLADDPDKRSDHLHDIATCGEEQISLDSAAIDRLCEQLNVRPRERARPARFKISRNTSGRSCVAYVHNSSRRGWCCTLSNGTPAGMSYAVGYCPDEQGLKFALEDAADDDARLALLREAVGRDATVEMI